MARKKAEPKKAAPKIDATPNPLPEVKTESQKVEEYQELTDSQLEKLSKEKVIQRNRFLEERCSVLESETNLLRDQIADINKSLKKGKFNVAAKKSETILQTDPHAGKELIQVRVRAGHKYSFNGVIHTPGKHATFEVPYTKLPNSSLLIMEPEKARKYKIIIPGEDLVLLKTLQ